MDIPAATSRSASFELKFSPNVDLVPLVRQFVEDFYDRVLPDPDATSRLALATHELLENAVKFAVTKETTLHVNSTRGPRGGEITVRTWNDATPENIEILRDRFHRMEGSNAFDHYQVLMGETAHQKEGSGLGIARIRAEADMTISYEIENDRVGLVAHAVLEDIA